MRYLFLSALLPALLVAFPAAADPWPAAARADFLQACESGARSRYKEAAVADYCQCAADRVGAGLSEAELQQLSRQQPLSPQLRQRLVALSSDWSLFPATVCSNSTNEAVAPLRCWRLDLAPWGVP